MTVRGHQIAPDIDDYSFYSVSIPYMNLISNDVINNKSEYIIILLDGGRQFPIIVSVQNSVAK